MSPHPALSVPVDSIAAMLDVAPIGVALVNSDGRVRWANPEFGRLFGRAPGDCVDRPFVELAGLCSGPGRVEARCRRTDGQEILLEVVEGPIAAADGGGSYRLVRDVTDQRLAETGLTQAVSMHRATLESTADGILVVDRQGRTVSYNHRFLDLWRIPDEVAAGGRDAEMLEFVLDQVSDPETFVARVEQLYAVPDESSYDEIRFRDGRIFERYSQPHQIDGRAVGRVWSFRDVTEARRSREALLFSEDKFANAFRSSPPSRCSARWRAPAPPRPPANERSLPRPTPGSWSVWRRGSTPCSA